MEPAASIEEPENDEVLAPAAGLPGEQGSHFGQNSGKIPEISFLSEASRKFKDNINMMKRKIHRYPRSIQDLGDWYTVPRFVAIGPYHHQREQLKDAENVKLVAAKYCINNSGLSAREMYYAVISAVAEIDARSIYNNDVMEGIDDDGFQHMMFFDACFLVVYILKVSGIQFDGDDTMLYDFFDSNDNDISHDIMLLENQIPWPVVHAIMEFMSVPLPKFIARWKCCRLHDQFDEDPPVPFDHRYDFETEPPHLLGLLRFHIVGRSRGTNKVLRLDAMKSIEISVSAIELAEMGINLKANRTTELSDMYLTATPIFFAKLSMAPLSLNDLRASLLVNMAAHELCTTPDFFDNEAKYEDSAVCSYLLLLCMLMHREEDVHQLRTKGILQGGAGLTNKKTLEFFTSLQSLRRGRCYTRVMVQICSYRINRQMRIKAFLYNYWKTILGLISVISAFGSILGAIKSLKGAH